MAAVVCVGVYLLPEQPPSALAKPINTAGGADREPRVARHASPNVAAPGLHMRSGLGSRCSPDRGKCVESVRETV